VRAYVNLAQRHVRAVVRGAAGRGREVFAFPLSISFVLVQPNPWESQSSRDRFSDTQKNWRLETGGREDRLESRSLEFGD